MKRIISLIALLLVLSMLPLAMFGCNSTEGETSATTTKPSGTSGTTSGNSGALVGTAYEVKDNLDKIKINGRYVITNRGVACDNVGSGIEFQGTMKGKVYLEIETVAVSGSTDGIYYTVYVDGVRQEERFKAKAGNKSTILTIADLGDPEAQHHIRVVKQTEARYARGQFGALTIDGTLGERPADRKYYVEFVGSDLICGMGNYNGLPEHEPSVAQTAQYEDGTTSVSFITAEALHADVSILGLSGMGVAGSWFKGSVNGVHGHITAPFYYKMNSYYRDKTTEYDFSKGRTPDLIVLNIGKNDCNIPKDERPDADTFKAAAKEYLQFLKATHGEDVKIIWTYDITEANPDKGLEANDCRYLDATEVINALGGEQAGIYIYQIYTNRLGGQEHTNAEGHVQAAQGLLDFIREKGILPVGQ